MKEKTKIKLLISICLIFYIVLGNFGLFLSRVSSEYTYKSSYLFFPDKLADDQDLSFSKSDISNIQIEIDNVNISNGKSIFLEILITSDKTATSQSVMNNGPDIPYESTIFRKVQEIYKDSGSSFEINRHPYDFIPHTDLKFIIIAWELNSEGYSIPEDFGYFSLQYSVEYSGKLPLWEIYSYFLGVFIIPVIPVIVSYRKINRKLEAKSVSASVVSKEPSKKSVPLEQKSEEKNKTNQQQGPETLYCPNCREKNPISNRFCMYCGTDLSEYRDIRVSKE